MFGKTQEATIAYSPMIFLWMAISGLLGYVIIRRSVKVILNLAEKAKHFAGEKIGEEIKISQGDELKDFALAFNRITDDLEKKIVKLEYSRSLTRELFQQIGQTITSTQKLEGLLTLIVQSLRKVLMAKAGFIAIYEKTVNAFS
ncbi:MAG: hypothetical protein ABSE95_11570 [Thermodesulfobacteriota bacterium]